MAEIRPPFSSSDPDPTVKLDPVGCISDRSRPESSESQSQNHSTTNTTTRRSQRNSYDRDDNTLELHEIETQHDDDSTGSISSGEYRVTTRRTVSRTSQAQRVRSQPQREGIPGRIQRFWTRHVVLTVSQRKNRDYFALERTFLAYVRTSVILAMQGVLIAQLFRLQGAHASHGLGYHEVGVPLSVTCHCAAIVTAVLGAHRFWKQQSAIALGTVHAGGWELNVIGILTAAITVVTFILSILVAVTIS